MYVSCSVRPTHRRFGSFRVTISARDRGKFASGIGPDGMAVVPDRPMPVVQPPALSGRLAKPVRSRPTSGHLSKRPFTNVLLVCKSALRQGHDACHHPRIARVVALASLPRPAANIGQRHHLARSDDIYSMSDPSSPNRLILRIEIPYDSRPSESDARPSHASRFSSRAIAELRGLVR